MSNSTYTLGIDIGSTTVKVAVLDEKNQLLFSDYERHFANIQETLAGLLQKAENQLGDLNVYPAITGSGGLTLARHLEVPFIQEVVAVATALETAAPQTDVAIELGGEDAKIIYFEGGNVEQRMNGICAGGTGSFIDQMASLLQTDASGLNEYAKNYQSLYTIAARCGVFAKSDIQPLINEGATKEDLSASIFQAVVNQTISGLACGKPIRGHVAFLGGPLAFPLRAEGGLHPHPEAGRRAYHRPGEFPSVRSHRIGLKQQKGDGRIHEQHEGTAEVPYQDGFRGGPHGAPFRVRA